MKWNMCGEFNKRVHLKTKSAEKVLCGRPQENYDTAEGEYTIEYTTSMYGSNLCKICKAKALFIESKTKEA